MANASSKKFGAGQQDQGKGDGTGGMTPEELDALPRTEILSNRDTSRHSEQRGLDSRHVQTQQHHEHVGNHAAGAGEPGPVDREKLADERPDADDVTTQESGSR
ncbi:MAG TPA: hypothetical protein PLL33_03880 [Paracoccus sp. (in: a-proteobacteria)]|nr:hypothetical protein [Paracoccus sp. (in: a-proteobacteria)]